MILFVLAACKSEPVNVPPNIPGKKGESEETSIKLSRYAIVYPRQTSTVVRDAALLLAESIQETIPTKVEVRTDDQRPAKESEQKEILIGATNRAASRAYYEETPSFRYDVYKRDAKIVLAGFTDVLTAEAVFYFIREYVSKANEGVITPVTDYTGGFENSLSLSAGGASDFCISFQAADRTNISYFSDALDAVEAKLTDKLGLSLPRNELTDSYDPTRAELVIGLLSFEALAEEYEALPLGGYMISVLENKLLLAASSESGYTDAVLALDKLLTTNTLYGTTDISIKIGETLRGVSMAMFENLPVPDKIPDEMLAAGNHAQLAIFRNVTEEFFASYTEKLAEAGFTAYTQTEFNGDGAKQKNCFATYVSDKNSVDLGFHEMFLSISPNDGSLTLPAQEAPEYTALDSIRYPTTLTQVGTKEFHPTEHAMCYILRLADGSFIVYDTSYGRYNQTGVAEEIYAILQRQAPDPNNIVISAIFLTHPHADHMGGFLQFADLYGGNPSLQVKQVVYNFPDTSLCRNLDTEINHIDATKSAILKFGAKTEVVKPRAGNVLYYADVKFNIFYTQENYLSVQPFFNDGNTMSMVTQMETAGGCKVVFGADHPAAEGVYGGTPFCESALAKWYGSFLESYVVTMFHHGLGGGADYLIYPAIKPKIVLWPGTWFRINGQSNGQPYKYGTGEEYKLYEHGYNQYFSTDLAPDVYHETPNANGVHGWFVADDGIQILTFFGERAVVATYETRDLYLGRR